MISVIMGKTDHVDGFEAPSFFFYRNLGALAAVNEQAAAVKTGHQRCEIAVRERHHASAPKQTNI